MPTSSNAILITPEGHTARITLPADPEQRATVIKAVINCYSLEAVDLTRAWTMWLDETGGMLGQHRRPLNPTATLVANRYGVSGGIRGPVVVTADDLTAIEPVIGEAAASGWTTP